MIKLFKISNTWRMILIKSQNIDRIQLKTDLKYISKKFEECNFHCKQLEYEGKTGTEEYEYWSNVLPLFRSMKYVLTELNYKMDISSE